MKMVTTTKIVEVKTREFEDNDIVLDRAWFAVGIRRYSPVSSDGSLWMVTPTTTMPEDRETRIYTDAEMSKLLDEGKFTFIGDYFTLRDNAPKIV